MDIKACYDKIADFKVIDLEEVLIYVGNKGISPNRLKTWIESAVYRLNGANNMKIFLRVLHDNFDKFFHDIVLNYVPITVTPSEEDDENEITKEAAYAISFNILSKIDGYETIIASKYKTRTDFKYKPIGKAKFEEIEIGGTIKSNNFLNYGTQKIDRIQKNGIKINGFISIVCFQTDNIANRFIRLDML